MGNLSVRITGRMWKYLRRQVLERDEYRCVKCGVIRRWMEIDHIIPLNKGGTNAIKNLQTLCYYCHKEKTKKDAGIFVEGQREWKENLKKGL